MQKYDEIKALVYTIELRDIYTQGHSERVGIYAKEFAKYLKLDEKKQEELYVAGLLHDLGKIGIPDSILLKPTQLDEEEYKLIKLHSVLSSQIVEKLPNYSYLAKIVKHHHENYDGSGYPDGLKEEEIPFESRILSIVDVFDALTTKRIYRKSLHLDEALDIMSDMRYKFDPKLFPKFIDFIKEFGIIKEKLNFLDETIAIQLKNNIFFNDALTKVLNREGILTIIRKASDFQYRVSLIEINIKNFKEYNFIFGLKKGDELLKNLAKELKNFFKAVTTILEPKDNETFLGRIKGDKFLLFYIGHKEEFLKYKIERFITNFDKIKLEYKFLIKDKIANKKILQEIAYLI